MSIFIIFTSTTMLLISTLLFFIYGWEMNLLREEISDVIIRKIYSTNISKRKLISDDSEEYKKKLENSIEKSIKERFINSYRGKGLLKALNNKNLYKTKETYLQVDLIILNSEKQDNSFMLKVKVDLRFVFPLLFLMKFVRSDEFKNKITVKKRVNFIFEEVYTIY